jgi:hypothetical protein
VATRVEKMTGATYMLQVLSDHEECRICLDPGTKRRCCGSYYCDDCYFALSRCRSCGQPVERNFRALGGSNGWGRTYIVTIILGWVVTLVVALLVFVVALVVALNELSSPAGISDYTCPGFFPTCGLSVCVGSSFNASVGLAPLANLADWRYCGLDTEFKIEARACVSTTVPHCLLSDLT